jgi:tetrahydromethanopterin S-methyltransferase subunit E
MFGYFFLSYWSFACILYGFQFPLALFACSWGVVVEGVGSWLGGEEPRAVEQGKVESKYTVWKHLKSNKSIEAKHKQQTK